MSKFTETTQLNKKFYTQYYNDNDILSVSRACFAKDYFKNWMRPARTVNNMPVYHDEDMFFSINPMKRGATNRNQKNVDSLNWCFADLDVFHENSKFAKMSAEEAYAQIKMMFDDEIPYPTVVIFSGRGFYLLWKLISGRNTDAKNKVSTNAAKRWKRINRKLNDKLKDFCADEGIAGDTARILRVPGSFNTKCKMQVNVIYSNPDFSYTLDEIDIFMRGRKDASDRQFQLMDNMQDFFGDNTPITYKREIEKYIKNNYIKYRHAKYGKASEKQLEFCRDLAKLNSISLPKNTKYYHEADKFIRKYYTPDKSNEDNESQQATFFYDSALENDSAEYLTENINDPYFKMYKKRTALIEQHVYNEPEQTGHREIILFVYRYYACLLFGNEKALEMTMSLNSHFSEPLSAKETEKATKSAKIYADKNGYKMTTAVFCAKTGISEEEYDSFNTHKKVADKKTKREINRAYYEKKLNEQGKAKKKDEVNARRAMVNHYYHAGKSAKEIAVILKVGISTVRRDIKANESSKIRAKARDAIVSNALYLRKKIVDGIIKSNKFRALGAIHRFKCVCSKNSDHKVLYVLCTSRERISKMHAARARHDLTGLVLVPCG